MPIYNVAPYVERALLSALNQTFESIEFLLVDDRGSDESMDIVRKIIQEHPRGKDVRIIEHPQNMGSGAARNTAIDNAKGEYLFFMDSDDEITPDCIQVLYDRMMLHPVDFVAGSILEITIDGVQNNYCLNDETRDGDFCLAKYSYCEKEYFYVMTWNKLYNMDFLKNNNIRCYPDHLNEDHVFTLQVTCFAKSFSLIPHLTAIYYRRVDSTTGEVGFSSRKARQGIDILKEYCRLIPFYMKSSLRNTFLDRARRASIDYIVKIIHSKSLSEEEKSEFYGLSKSISSFVWKTNILSNFYGLKASLFFIYFLLPYKIEAFITKIAHRDIR